MAKQVFQVHGVDAHGKVVVRKQLRRKAVVEYFTKLPACERGREAGSRAITGRGACKAWGIG